MNAERQAVYEYGARFFRQDGEVMFEFVIDAMNKMGPKPADEHDITKHPDAYAKFEAAEDVNSEETEEPPGGPDKDRDQHGRFKPGKKK